MSTNIARMGPNSVAVGYSSGTTIAQFLAAMTSALTAQGWELYDDAASATSKVYRAPIADGTMAYKYLEVSCASAGYMMSKVYELWNVTTHVGTNPAYNSDTPAWHQRVSFAEGGTMYVFATPRYALFLSKISSGAIGNGANTFCGLMEVSRDNMDEVPGQTPIFGWIEGAALLGTHVASTTCGCFSPVRVRTGNATGYSAWWPQSIGTIMGRTMWPGTKLGAQTLAGPDRFNTANINAFNLYWIDMAGANQTLTILRGRLYGLKALSSQVGSALDKLDIKVDSDMFFDPKSITAIPHVVMSEAHQSGRFAIPL